MVAVVFTDMVGSTELLTRLGDEGADEVRRRHFGALRSAIRAFDGTEVKNLGDGLMVTFPSAADAIAAAVAMQQAVAVDNRRSPVAVGLRVAVAAGDATFEDGDWFGTPVVEAARLCARADAGQILATEVVSMLAAGRSEHVTEPLAPLELKGLPRPVSAVAVRWQEPRIESSLPPFLAAAAATPLTGRARELKELDAAWDEVVADGTHGIVLLAGEPGIGKTRLVAELAARRRTDGAIVLLGRCDEDAPTPYQPFVEALRDYATSVPPEQLRAELGRWAPVLVRLLPELEVLLGVTPDPPAQGETERARLFEAVGAAFQGIACRAPLLLVLEDLHWADGSSVSLLRHHTRHPPPAPVLVVGTYREGDLAGGHPLVAALPELRREPRVRRLALEGLDPIGVADLVEQFAVPDVDVEEIRARTEGNPFYVVELLRHAGDAGVVATAIPERVQEVVGQRLARLSGATHQLLRAAAVVGREFDLDVVAAATDATEDEVLELLDEALASRLVAEVPDAFDHYAFSHALVREALYDGLSASRRVRLHFRVALALEERRPDDVVALAHHHGEAAEAGDTGAAVRYALAAADRALDLFAFEEAVAAAERGLRLADADVDRTGLLVRLSKAQQSSGAAEESLASALAAVDAARRSGDCHVFGAAAIQLYFAGFGARGYANTPEGVSALREALDAVSSTSMTLRAQLLASLVMGVSGVEPAERLAVAEEAVAAARASGDGKALAGALLSKAFSMWGPHPLDDVVDALDEGLRLVDQHGNPTHLDDIEFWRFGLAASRSDGGALRAHVRRLAGTPGGRARYLSTMWSAALAILEGRWGEAEQLAATAAALPEGGRGQLASANYGIQLHAIRREQGRGAELVPTLESTAARVPDFAPYQYTLASLYADVGRLDDARRVLRTVLDDPTRRPVDDSNWGICVLAMAHAAVLVEDTDAAAELYPLIAACADRQVMTGEGVVCHGSLAQPAGRLASLLGRHDEAEALFTSAAGDHDALGAPALNAWNSYYHGLARQRAGRDGAALLAEAEAVAVELDMTLLRRLLAAAS